MLAAWSRYSIFATTILCPAVSIDASISASNADTTTLFNNGVDPPEYSMALDVV
jgi:hypothetical protein